MHPERLTGVVVTHSLAAEQDVQAFGEILRLLSRLAGLGQPAEREHGEILGRDDIDLVSRPPHLRKARVLPHGGGGAVHTCVDGEQRGPRHAVLQPGPRCTVQGTWSCRKPLVQRSDTTTERENLRSCDFQRCSVHGVLRT